MGYDSRAMDPTFLIALIAAAAAAVALILALRGRGGDSELAGRLAQLAEQQAAAQSHMAESLQAQERALTRMLEERLADVSRRVGDTLQKQATDTANAMGDLKAHLAVIGKAQENITKLSQEVVSLQEVLSNKQTRGAFGEVRLEDQVRDALPPGAYAFQATLGNNSRVDCLLRLPNPPGSIAVDAKFPLESYRLLRDATDEKARSAARRAFASDVLKHVNDIAEKYIVPGETADSALMFLPSEAIYAEIHAELPEVVERSHRLRVYIVSPTTIMATLTTIRAVLRDAQMREQAGLIQQEVRRMADDVGRLDDRVASLQRHFGQVEEDIRQIRISTYKVTKRAARIDEVELEEADREALPEPRAAGAEGADR
jgi:DNA recombination protein RmuC